ncbi:hypothetical protein LCGC14_0312430 [marine sediment metagenome]|uniref:Glycosyl-hydrolase family 116 catalytic region domain-containing protein n=1 Tax=marine sediment metagenome TaxID=412755 RepID=A0A0F9W8X1_9ZZZZ|nr:hypothetical protein [Phycisphaerae bacterium]HDZ44813.1 hypothetical protein [Phycisphaerae bacterium]
MSVATNRDWPVLTTYDSDHLARIALPLGGIGTGTVSLGGRGDLRDWEIVNRPAKTFVPGSSGIVSGSAFLLHAKQAGKPAVTKLLEGPLDVADYEGGMGASAPAHGLPRFRDCQFAAAYPFGQVLLTDPSVPLDVRLEAFNPLIPADADASGIPVAVLRYVLINRTNKPVRASICGGLPNFIGTDGAGGECKGNVNTYRESGKVRGLFFSTTGLPASAETFGTMALTTTTAGPTSCWTNIPDDCMGWHGGLLDFWQDFSDDGKLDKTNPAESDHPHGMMTVSVTVPPRASKDVTFLLTWHFPNRQTWSPVETEGCCDGGQCDNPNWIGNYYTTQYADAWDVAIKFAPQLAKLETQTAQFVQAVVDSDLPAEVREAALFNLSTLRSQTVFRTPDGRLFGFEGCHDHAGCCNGSCTHVWNYENATPFLFGDLARTMRDVEFGCATHDNGLMSFRAALPIERAQESPYAAADGQMGCIMKMYRDWQLSGDDAFLKRLWPKVKKALAFCWVEGGWDADRDGVMEGCQHNTMDVEYYGPNPQMTGWYLGALRAAEEMARYVGETDFAETCRSLFTRGSKWMDENLFNGEYYEHEIRPPKKTKNVDSGFALAMGGNDAGEPQFQLGTGCLVDQLVGQYMAHVMGLGYLHDPKKVKTTLRSIGKHNWVDGVFDHFNCMRSFILGDEQALLMASYPKGDRPKRPFPYFTEVMTGFEYTAAIGMLQEGQRAAGLKVIRAIRNRYDGRKRSPFDEAECGHHYARAMASWAALLTLTGFHYSGVTQSIAFAPAKTTKAVTWFWSNGYAWGTIRQRRSAKKIAVELTCLRGGLTLKELTLTGWGSVKLAKARTILAGRTWNVAVPKE